VPHARPVHTKVLPLVIVMTLVAKVIVPTVPVVEIRKAPRTVVNPVTVIVSLLAALVPLTKRTVVDSPGFPRGMIGLTVLTVTSAMPYAGTSSHHSDTSHVKLVKARVAPIAACIPSLSTIKPPRSLVAVHVPLPTLVPQK